jgi:hypothetical protein
MAEGEFNMMENILTHKVNHLENQQDYWKRLRAPDSMVLKAVQASVNDYDESLEIIEWVIKNWSFLSLDIQKEIQASISEKMGESISYVLPNYLEWRSILSL